MMIPYGKQNINQQDIDAVVDVLQSDFITQGPCVQQFEQALCQYTGAQYATAVNSATSALHIACRALGLSANDRLWTSPITFVASANCGLYCGATIDFVDIDPQSYNLCPQQLARKLEQAKQENKLPKILVPVHLSGQSCDMQAIRELADEYNFYIIEDASHAIGGRYQKQTIGACQYSDITVFSFHPVKIITTGEGGCALTNHPELAEKLTLLKSHGITRDPQKMTNDADGPWYYEQIDLGYNYRMTDLQAALGISQLTRIDPFIAQRKQVAERYNTWLADSPITRPHCHKDSDSAHHLYIIRLQLEHINKSHKAVFNELREHGIGVNLHYIPVYKQPFYQERGFSKNYCANAEKYYQEAISLPIFPDLTEKDQGYIVETLQGILK